MPKAHMSCMRQRGMLCERIPRRHFSYRRRDTGSENTLGRKRCEGYTTLSQIRWQFLHAHLQPSCQSITLFLPRCFGGIKTIHSTDLAPSPCRYDHKLTNAYICKIRENVSKCDCSSNLDTHMLGLRRWWKRSKWIPVSPFPWLIWFVSQLHPKALEVTLPLLMHTHGGYR